MSTLLVLPRARPAAGDEIRDRGVSLHRVQIDEGSHCPIGAFAIGRADVRVRSALVMRVTWAPRPS
ncbi:MAG TPA: hypothetical protein VIK61_15355 [Acidimicrobiia bacterium]